ncbi:hypothetical protein CwatDRAFT_3099 [Crocosphaera watsonii WH 8501]|uniref:HNH domain-containing protein n=1 Tax=Crocosphaera watsonii WH 8501 TaxID=165597 RepID=Q4C2S7_CROWT|nr:hypothetical protein CwatDRAFT_3099 [Crocosphaera watsonii WH 8501]
MIEVDHIIPKSKGGKDTYNNLQALHRHCHDVKSKNDVTAHRNKKVLLKSTTNNIS